MTQAELDEVARKLNGRPRQTLGFRTPAKKLTELIDGLHTGAPRALISLRPTAFARQRPGWDETMRNVTGGALTG